MNCPTCNGLMEVGHLCAGGHRIIWTQQERKWSAHVGGDDVLVQRMTFLGKNTTKAYICKHGKKMLVEYLTSEAN